MPGAVGNLMIWHPCGSDSGQQQGIAWAIALVGTEIKLVPVLWVSVQVDTVTGISYFFNI
jgi:hypothetical protein